MESVLIVSESSKITSFVQELLHSAGLNKISVAVTADSARRLTIDLDYDMYIVDTPLSEENGELLCQSLAEKNTSQILMLVPSEFYGEMSEKVELYGVITVPKPLDRTTLWTSVKVAQAMFHKMRLMQKENNSLQNKIEEIRIVDRAKCILIADYSLNEQDAHKFIEQQAMNLRKTRREVAEEIISNKK